MIKIELRISGIEQMAALLLDINPGTPSLVVKQSPGELNGQNPRLGARSVSQGKILGGSTGEGILIGL